MTPFELRLRRIVRGLGSCLVGFSGGVDSSVLLRVACEELGDRAVALLGVSPSVATAELEHARAVAEEMGASLIEVATNEMSDPGYRRNGGDRCYYCKNELWSIACRVAARRNLRWVCDGANLDDRSDHRPGRRAAQEHGVRSPLAEAGLRKTEVRELARRLGLSVAEKPSSPCLSSRIAYGVEVTEARLRQIELAEAALREMGFEECRVRSFGPLAVVAVPKERLASVASQAEEIAERVKGAGFLFVTLDLDGLVSGSLNRLLEVQ